MRFLKILIPSWRFFAQTESIPRLYVSKPSSGGDWVLALKRPQWNLLQLFLNPRTNDHHACCNAVEALMQEPENQRAYRVVTGIVRRHLLEEDHASQGTGFQFKITVLQFASPTPTETDVLISAPEVI